MLATWARPAPVFELAMEVLREFVDIPVPPPGSPGIFTFKEESALEGLLAGSGFTEIGIERLDVPIIVTNDGRDYWDFVSTVSGPIPALVRQQPEALRREIADAVSRAAEARARDGTISLGGITLIASATKEDRAVG